MERYDLLCKKNVCGYSWDVEDPKAVICIIHGIGEYALRYDHVAQSLNSRGYAVFTADMPGHGYNQDKRGHAGGRKALMGFVEALIQKAQTSHPDVPVFVYGHSMGGNIALAHRMLIDNVAGYIITSPWLIIPNPYSKSMMFALSILSKIAPAMTIETKLDSSAMSHTIKEAEAEPDPLMHGFISLITGYDRIIDAAKILKNAGQPGAPLLLMHGSIDRVCLPEGSRQFKAAAGNQCTFVEWENCLHEVHNETAVQEQFLKTIADWLDSRV